MFYFIMTWKKVIDNKVLRLFFLLEIMSIIFSLYESVTVIDKDRVNFTVYHLLNYCMNYSLFPILFLWSTIYLINLITTTYDVRLLISKGVSRLRVFIVYMSFIFTFIVLNLLIFIILFIIGLKVLAYGVISINILDFLEYISMWIIGQFTMSIVVFIFSMVLKKRYVVFIVSTGFYALQKYDFFGKLFLLVYNPIIYARSIYFMTNRPPLSFLYFFSSIVIFILLIISYKVFEKKDLSIWY